MVSIARVTHLIPFRTQQLRLLAAMVLHAQACERVARRQFYARFTGLFFCPNQHFRGFSNTETELQILQPVSIAHFARNNSGRSLRD